MTKIKVSATLMDKECKARVNSLKTCYQAALVIMLVFVLIHLHAVSATACQHVFRQETTQAISDNSTRKQQDAVTLIAGKSIEREIDKGHTHTYQLILTAGQYLHLIVDQRGIDVALTLFSPGGKKLSQSDTPYGWQGAELLLHLAEASGPYRLEVRALEFNPFAPARYEISVKELRAAVPQDKDRVVAEQAFSEAENLRYKKTAEAQTRALTLYGDSLLLFKLLGDRAREARAFYGIAEVYNNTEQKEKALDNYKRALQAQRLEGKPSVEVRMLRSLGSLYVSMERFEEALGTYQNALQISRNSRINAAEAAILLDISLTYARLRDKQKASYYLTESVRIRKSLEQQRGKVELPVLTPDIQDDNQKLLDYYNRVLRIQQAAGEHFGEADTMRSIGAVYMDLGENQKALDYYHRALQIHRTLEDSSGPDRILQLFNKVDLLHVMGLAYIELGDKQNALNYFNQALSKQRTHQAVLSRPTENSLLYEIGKVYNSMGEKQKAAEHYHQSISLNLEHLSAIAKITLYLSIGDDYAALGDKQKALDHFNLSLSLSREVGDHQEEAATLYKLAQVERDNGNLITSRTQIEAALSIIESLRINIASQELRDSFFASVQKYYEFDIDLLMQLHKHNSSEKYDSEALRVSESARARSLLELLSEARANIRQGVDPILLEREHSLQQRLNAKAKRQRHLRSNIPLKEQTEAVAEEIEALEREIQSLVTEYQQVKAEIRIKSPHYATLTQPQPLNLEEIQTQVLDADTVLLEYSLGTDRSHLWAVTPTSITSYELPKREEIETAARRFYKLITASPRQSANAAPAKRETGDILQREDGTQLKQAASQLSRMLLAPVAPLLGRKRLLIVGDGALQYIPFAALPTPTANLGSASSTPLIVEHEIVNLPSASTLAVLRRETSGHQPAPKTLAVLADPIFERGDERLKARPVEKRASDAGSNARADEWRGRGEVITTSAKQSGLTDAGLRIRRLPGTRREADEIVKLVPPTDYKKALDFAANRETATSPDLSHYRYVHFATHGFLNSQHPELSGIVLSMFDEQGAPQDGFLRAHEIFNLKLNADVVVLSACRTGLGKEIRGEGLVGLARGFMYAGSPRVVVSLWNVNDTATAELMTRFYRGMLVDKLRPAKALQAAQVSMLNERRYSAPFYWAAFTLQGEWR